jgi:hypothetical protein
MKGRPAAPLFLSFGIFSALNPRWAVAKNDSGEV